MDSHLTALVQEDFKHLSRKLTRQFIESQGGERAFVMTPETEGHVEAYTDAFFLNRPIYKSAHRPK